MLALTTGMEPLTGEVQKTTQSRHYPSQTAVAAWFLKGLFNDVVVPHELNFVSFGEKLYWKTRDNNS
jgi:hypothetical protein